MSEKKLSIWDKRWNIDPYVLRLFQPKMLRRYAFALTSIVTVIALFYSVENWRGKNNWERYRKEQESQGANFEYSSVIPAQVPEEKNFALTPLLKPLYELNPPGVEPRYRNADALAKIPDLFPQPYGPETWDIPSLRSWRYGFGSTLSLWQKAIFASTNFQHHAEMGKPAEDVLYALKQFDSQLAELQSASALRPLTRYPIHYEQEDKIAILLPHLAKLKGISKTLAVKAMAHLETGEIDKAFADVNLIFFLAEPLGEEPFYISQLVRYSCFEYGLRAIWLGTQNHAWRKEHLDHWQKTLSTYDLIKDNYRGLNGERIIGLSILDQYASNPAQLWSKVMSGDNIYDFVQRPNETEAWISKIIPRGWYSLEKLNFDITYKRFIMSSAAKDRNSVDVQKLNATQQEFDALLGRLTPFKEVSKHMVMVSKALPQMSHAHLRAIYTQSTIDLTVTTLALESFYLTQKDYPSSLDELMPAYIKSVPSDLISKAPLKYERQSKDSFRLWSVGWNMKDDGGTIVRNGTQKDASIKIEDGDWTWPQLVKE